MLSLVHGNIFESQTYTCGEEMNTDLSDVNWGHILNKYLGTNSNALFQD